MADQNWFDIIWNKITTPGGTSDAEKSVMNRIDLERMYPSWSESQLENYINQSHQMHKAATGQVAPSAQPFQSEEP